MLYPLVKYPTYTDLQGSILVKSPEIDMYLNVSPLFDFIHTQKPEEPDSSFQEMMTLYTNHLACLAETMKDMPPIEDDHKAKHVAESFTWLIQLGKALVQMSSANEKPPEPSTYLVDAPEAISA